MLRLLLSHCLAPMAARMQSWILTATAADTRVDRLSAASTSRPPGGPSTGAAMQGGPGWYLPAFLQPLRHEFEQSGKQMRLLGELEAIIGGHQGTVVVGERERDPWHQGVVVAGEGAKGGTCLPAALDRGNGCPFNAKACLPPACMRTWPPPTHAFIVTHASRPCTHAGPLTSRLEHMSRIECREAKQLMEGHVDGANGD